MAEPLTITLVTAIWGALTGTLAVGIQLFGHITDRGRLSITGSMSQVVDRTYPKPRLCVAVNVCNHGRRPVVIEQIGLKLPSTPDPKAIGPVLTTAPLFDARTSGEHLRLAEGEKREFRIDPFPPMWGRALYKQGVKGEVFARLTSGKEHSASFFLINPDHFPPDTVGKP